MPIQSMPCTAGGALLGGQAEAQLFHLACSKPPFLMLPGLERLDQLGIVPGAGLDGDPRGLEPGQRLGDPRPFGLPLRSQDVVGCLPHRIQAWIGQAMDPSTMSCGHAAWPVAAASVGTADAVRAWDELTNALASTQVVAAWKKAVNKWRPEVRGNSQGSTREGQPGQRHAWRVCAGRKETCPAAWPASIVPTAGMRWATCVGNEPFVGGFAGGRCRR